MFLQAVCNLYMYFKPAWLTTLTKSVGHSATYSLSFRLLFIWLQECFSPARTWNFSQSKCLWLCLSIRVSELRTVSNTAYSSVYCLLDYSAKSSPFLYALIPLSNCSEPVSEISNLCQYFSLEKFFVLFPGDADLLPLNSFWKVLSTECPDLWGTFCQSGTVCI